MTTRKEGEGEMLLFVELLWRTYQLTACQNLQRYRASGSSEEEMGHSTKVRLKYSHHRRSGNKNDASTLCGPSFEADWTAP